MKVFVQHATDPKSNPEELDSSDWKNLTKKPEPNGTEIIDSTKGWIQSICVMGVTFKADHYAIVENPSGHPQGTIKVVQWFNDPEELTPDKFFAREWYFEPMKLVNRKWICKQPQTLYVSENEEKRLIQIGYLPLNEDTIKCQVKRFIVFVKPEDALVRHGININDELNAEYVKEESHNYREWI